MSTHIREAEDSRGDLVDIYYFCTEGCYRDSFQSDRLGNAASEGGAYPCAESDPGSEVDVYCDECGVLIASPDKETPIVVNLIERPPFHTH